MQQGARGGDAGGGGGGSEGPLWLLRRRRALFSLLALAVVGLLIPSFRFLRAGGRDTALGGTRKGKKDDAGIVVASLSRQALNAWQRQPHAFERCTHAVSSTGEAEEEMAVFYTAETLAGGAESTQGAREAMQNVSDAVTARLLWRTQLPVARTPADIQPSVRTEPVAQALSKIHRIQRPGEAAEEDQTTDRTEEAWNLDAGSCFRICANMLPRGATSNACRSWETYCLPSLLVPGTQKGGTTALQDFLKDSPCFMISKVEVHFFDRLLSVPAARTLYPAYLSLYRVPEEMRRRGRAPMMLDKTPHYLAARLPAHTAAALVPSAKSIITLRNPVDRYYSFYSMACRRNEGFTTVVSQPPAGVTRICRRDSDPLWPGLFPLCSSLSPEASPRRVECSAELFESLMAGMQVAQEHFAANPAAAFPVDIDAHTVQLHDPRIGFEGAALRWAYYAPQVENWVAAFPRGEQVVVTFYSDFRYRLPAVWHLTMWLMGVEGARGQKTPVPGFQGSYSQGSSLSLGGSDSSRSSSSGSSSKKPTKSSALDPAISRARETLERAYCPQTHQLAELIYPVRVPSSWPCAEEANSAFSSGQAGQFRKRPVHVSVSVTHVAVPASTLQQVSADHRKHLSERELKVGGHWEVHRIQRRITHRGPYETEAGAVQKDIDFFVAGYAVGPPSTAPS